MGKGTDVDKLWDSLVERTTESIELDFIGVPVYIVFPCNCELCKKGKEALAEKGGKGRRGLQLHIMVQPINVEWDLQHIYIDMERSWKFSRKNAFITACKELGIPVKPFEEFKKFMMSNIFEFKKTTVKGYFEEKGVKLPDLSKIDERTRATVENVLNAQLIVPVKIIPKDALELYEIDRDELKFKVKLGKTVAKLMAEGRSKDEIAQVIAKLTEEYMGKKTEEEKEETEEEEEKVLPEIEKEEEEEKESKKSKKAKKVEEEEEEEFL